MEKKFGEEREKKDWERWMVREDREEKKERKKNFLRGEERERYNLFIYFLSFELQWAVMFDKPL